MMFLPFRQLCGQLIQRARRHAALLEEELMHLDDEDMRHAETDAPSQGHQIEHRHKLNDELGKLQDVLERLPDLQMFLGRRWFLANLSTTLIVAGLYCAIPLVSVMFFDANLSLPPHFSSEEGFQAVTSDEVTGFAAIYAIISIYVTGLVAPLLIDLLERFVLAK